MNIRDLGEVGATYPRNPEAISSLIQRIIMRHPQLRVGYELYRLRAMWMEDSHPYVGRATEEFILRRGELTIVLNNAALRIEFNALREQIRSSFNERMGYEAVKRLVFR